MSKLFVTAVVIFMFLSLSSISGLPSGQYTNEVTGSYPSVPEISDDDDILTARQFYGLGEQSSNFDSADEDKVRLGKHFGKPKGRRQTVDWNRPERGLENEKDGEQCCGMWGRSLRNVKNGSVRKSSINGFESAKSVMESASSAGLTTIPGSEGEDKLPEWKTYSLGMRKKFQQPNDPSQYRKFGSKK
jgi:hypothetical protein